MRPLTDNAYHQYARGHFDFRPIRNACLAWALVILLYFFLVPRVHAQSAQEHERAPANFSSIACYQLVQDVGRMIAWARWEEGFSLEKTRSAPFREGTPVWIVDMVNGWITDAYQWQPTDEQVLQWATELGDARNLPHAAQLDVHQTIAIWMRRIGRQCSAPRV